MLNLKTRSLVISISVLLVTTSLWGCAAHHSRPAALAQPPRALNKEDVVNMATSDIGDDVITAQIRATGSRFALSVSDITELKKAGVSEKVIEYMISTGKESEAQCTRHFYRPSYTVYSYYPSVRVVYRSGARWHYYPRRGGRGIWIKTRR